MSTIRGLRMPGVCLALVLCASMAAPAADAAPGAEPSRLRISDVSTAPAPVAAWDARSPQRLVRLEGKLYQQDSGFYFRVAEDRISIRLADGVLDWEALVEQARSRSPETFALLEELVPLRSNRLGIVDLEVARGDVAEWCDLVFRTGLVEFAEVSTFGVWLVAPNDPQYPQQWALDNTGQTGGTAGADIRAEAAWDISAGSPETIVAVLDSGTNVDHPDLAANVWHNEDEVPGNSLDDDGNGYVDDWEGWDFGNGNNDPRSSNFHGSHVTGIINAAGGNGIGIAGLAGGIGGPGVRAMALAVGESGPIGSVLDDAILYAADNGAQVITMSLSVGSSSAINTALDYAYNTRDVFIDCAAGNNGSSVAYPANRPEVMAVASTTDNDTHSSFSNSGPEVEIAAPGSDILSTQLGTSYGTSSGTSFAAPYVAALAALIRTVNPGLPASEVRQLIIESADDVGTPGFDQQTGHGRINAVQALTMTSGPDGRIDLDAETYSCEDMLTVTLSDIDLAGSGTTTVSVRSGIEPGGEIVTLSEIGSGAGVFRGALPTSSVAAVADGALQVMHQDTLIAEYLDVDDGQGGSNVVKLSTAVTDCVGPLVLDATISSIDDTSASIDWITDEPGTTLVRYGEFVPPQQQTSTGGLSTAHSVDLNGLQPCTVYKYEIESRDALGNVTIDDNGGQYYNVETFVVVPGEGVAPCHQGQAALDRPSYSCSDTMQIAVTDVDLGTDAQVVETVSVRVTSTSEPLGEWVVLTEESPDSSRFEGTIDVEPSVPSPDGVLAVAPGDLITVTYYDADDGDGKPNVEAKTASADCSGPVISGVRVVALSATRAEVMWSTDEPASSRVEFGPTVSLGSTVEDLELKTSHNLAISAFEACDRVHFRVAGADVNGDLRQADAAGAPFEFNLHQVGGLLFHDNFETDAGWILRGEWDRGIPGGLGSDSADPGSAYSGSMVLGIDLTGSGPYPGDYEPVAREWAFSPTMNASQAANLELVLRRKLGVRSGDLANIAILDPAWQEIWSNGGTVDDADWTEVRYSLGAADGASVLRIGFGMESSGPGQSFGWNIDEVIIKDSTQPDYLSCGGCAETPSFAGVKTVVDPAPCGATGLVLQWEIAPAWGSGAVGTYDVHRGTSAGFVPDPGNRVASGLIGTLWTDTTVPVDTPVWYVVRARNDESCAGGEGLADVNLTRIAGVDSTSQPGAGSPGSSVRVTDVGDAHVRLSWDPVPGAVQYVVRRSSSFDYGAPVEVGTVPGTVLENENAMLDGSSYSYRVSAVNGCGQETP